MPLTNLKNGKRPSNTDRLGDKPAPDCTIQSPFASLKDKHQILLLAIEEDRRSISKTEDPQQLKAELDSLVQKINGCLIPAKETPDPTIEWLEANEKMREFSAIVEEADKSINNMSVELEKLRKKYKKSAKSLFTFRSKKISPEKNVELQKLEMAKSNIYSCIDPPFAQFKERYSILKANIEREKNSSEKYLDSDQMVSELIVLLEKIDRHFDTAEKDKKSIKDCIEFSTNPTDELAKAIAFKHSVDEAMTKINDTEENFCSIQNKYRTSPEAVLARKTKMKSHQIGQVENLEKYKLPIELVYQNEQKRIRRYDLGSHNVSKPHKTIMMIGMTGAGKSLMINNIINYVYGISYEDKFRFELIVDTEEIEERGENASKSKADSMTSWVTGFNLYHQEGFRDNFGLTIIDTPGFGDTRGIKYDEKIVDQIKDFFMSTEACPAQEIDCVGFVIQASTARITEDQKYVFDQVLNVFGKDMKENVFLMFTFADAQAAPALEVVKSHRIPFAEGCVFKFNNSALFAPNTNPNSEFSWNFGYNSLKEYFYHVGGITPTSLSQTVDVLEEREYLKLLLGGLQPRIDQGMNILQSIETMIQSIVELRGTAKANKDFKVKKTTYPQTTKVVNHYITNCKSCMFTCHDPCYIAGDQKQGCAAMSGGKCFKCSGCCPWDMHTNGDRIYVYTEVESEDTIQDMCEKYNVAIGDKNAKKDLARKLFEEYKTLKADVFDDIWNASEAAKRLEVIALRNTFLTNVVYIERLIKSEELSNRPNKKGRLEQLNDVLKRAKILEDAKENPNRLTHHVNEYEETILKKINNIKEEFEYDYWSYFRFQNSRNEPARRMRNSSNRYSTYGPNLSQAAITRQIYPCLE